MFKLNPKQFFFHLLTVLVVLFLVVLACSLPPFHFGDRVGSSPGVVCGDGAVVITSESYTCSPGPRDYLETVNFELTIENEGTGYAQGLVIKASKFYSSADLEEPLVDFEGLSSPCHFQLAELAPGESYSFSCQFFANNCPSEFSSSRGCEAYVTYEERLDQIEQAEAEGEEVLQGIEGEEEMQDEDILEGSEGADEIIGVDESTENLDIPITGKLVMTGCPSRLPYECPPGGTNCTESINEDLVIDLETSKFIYTYHHDFYYDEGEGAYFKGDWEGTSEGSLSSDGWLFGNYSLYGINERVAEGWTGILTTPAVFENNLESIFVGEIQADFPPTIKFCRQTWPESPTILTDVVRQYHLDNCDFVCTLEIQE